MSLVRPVVLVVEDDLGTWNLLRDLLEPAGYAVESAPDGLSALARLAAGGVDLLLLDLMLPDLDGLELCRQVRASEAHTRLPIIMLTALGSDAQRHAGFAAGADDYVTKPFNLQELLDRVAVWTRARQWSAAEQTAPEPATASPGTAPPVAVPLAIQADSAVGPPQAAESPATWCRRLLDGLREQPRQGPEIASLEMLISSCIELDPTPEAFAELLARHVASGRPSIAEAARVLQRAWWRDQASAGAADPPPLQETLRTLGGLLDQSGAQMARVALTPGSAEMSAYSEVRQQRLGQRELRQAIGARKARRGEGPRRDPTEPTRYETLLRAVGLLLDNEPDRNYDLVVTPRKVVVDSPSHGSQIFTVDQLAALLQASIHGRQSSAPAEP
jgi:CheY-like chemotaxis protein